MLPITENNNNMTTLRYPASSLEASKLAQQLRDCAFHQGFTHYDIDVVTHISIHESGVQIGTTEIVAHFVDAYDAIEFNKAFSAWLASGEQQ